MKKQLLKLSAGVLASLTLVGCNQASTPNASSTNSGETIATVGNVNITKDEFYEAMKNLAGESTLKTMILEEVLKANVKDQDALKKEAADEVAAQIKEAGGEEVFNQFLAYQKLGTAKEFEYQLFIRKMFQEVVGNEIDTSDEAIKNYYDNEYKTTMEAQHILVETEDEAKAVLERLKNGEEFDAVAKEVSKDSTAANGGLLGKFTEGQMVAEFEAAVKGGKNGEVVPEPVKSQFGYHVIKVLDNGQKKPLDEIKDQVVEQYKNARFADSQFAFSILGRLVKNADVKINDADLKHAVDDLIKMADQKPVESTPAPSSQAPASSEEEQAASSGVTHE